ncbi:hypothetical protein [Tenggerimyces flavus]|uniref:Uncharacterized protein n=1 Tax=Tenggerimyces flavus TaxID=1708749 RepID=A0ABV7Y9N2_9ACTN|nr:hypothetical protein [Tenggerimyces flavus]MBM7788871.1 hypothetical protein [Tenggerimyces flavus]
MTPIEAERLAYAINSLRPDWPRSSLQTLFAKHLAKRTLHDAAVAMVWVATDPATQTPGRVLENGPWWGASLTTTSEAERHPSAQTYVPPTEPCDLCGRTRRQCEQRSNGTHEYRPRQEFKRVGAYERGLTKARAAIGAPVAPTTDDESETP